MKNFAEKLHTDTEEREKFINFMHGREEKIKKGSAAIAEKLNPFYMNLVKDFAEQEGYELDDSPAVQEKCKEICKKIAEDMQANIIKQFSNLLK